MAETKTKKKVEEAEKQDKPVIKNAPEDNIGLAAIMMQLMPQLLQAQQEQQAAAIRGRGIPQAQSSGRSDGLAGYYELNPDQANIHGEDRIRAAMGPPIHADMVRQAPTGPGPEDLNQFVRDYQAGRNAQRSAGLRTPQEVQQYEANMEALDIRRLIDDPRTSDADYRNALARRDALFDSGNREAIDVFGGRKEFTPDAPATGELQQQGPGASWYQAYEDNRRPPAQRDSRASSNRTPFMGQDAPTGAGSTYRSDIPFVGPPASAASNQTVPDPMIYANNNPNPLRGAAAVAAGTDFFAQFMGQGSQTRPSTSAPVTNPGVSTLAQPGPLTQGGEFLKQNTVPAFKSIWDFLMQDTMSQPSPAAQRRLEDARR